MSSVKPVTPAQWLQLREARIIDEQYARKLRMQQELEEADKSADDCLGTFWSAASSGAAVNGFFIVRDVPPLVEEAICRKLSEFGWKYQIDVQEYPRDLNGDETFCREVRVVT